MAPRRYSEEEVAKILDAATEVTSASTETAASGEGMTLAEVQDIAREVGIPAERVSSAAARLDTPPSTAAPTRKALGSVIGVGRTVELKRPLTEEEWTHLVVDLRSTFEAMGAVRVDGAFRQWRNGNLLAALEPTLDGGERLRLQTLKGDAGVGLGGGAVLLGFSVLVGTVALVTGSPFLALPASAVGFTGLLGAGWITAIKLTLPRWAETRQLQMDTLVERLLERMAESTPELTDGGEG